MIAGSSDEHRAGYEGWRVAFASSVGVFVSFASLLVYTFGIFLKPLAEEFSWSREAVSAAFGIAAMTAAVSSPILGVLFDRVPPRMVILPGLLVFGAAFASLSLLTPPIWHLYAIFIVLGVVANATAQMAYSRAVSTWFHERLGMALAIVMAGGAVGSIVLPPVAEMLIARIGWRQACVALGGMVLVVGLPVVGGVVRNRPSASVESQNRATGASLREGLSSRAFWILVVVLFLSSIAQNGAITHMSALLTDRGVSAGAAAVAVSAMGAASLVGRLAAGWLLDRFFAGRVAFALLTVAAVGTFLLATAHSLAIGALAAAMIGLGMGGESDVTPYMLSRYFGLRSFSVLLGFTWTAYATAGAIGPILMGRVFDATGSYKTLLVILGALSFVAAVLMLLSPAYAENPLGMERTAARRAPR